MKTIQTVLHSSSSGTRGGGVDWRVDFERVEHMGAVSLLLRVIREPLKPGQVFLQPTVPGYLHEATEVNFIANNSTPRRLLLQSSGLRNTYSGAATRSSTGVLHRRLRRGLSRSGLPLSPENFSSSYYLEQLASCRCSCQALI